MLLVESSLWEGLTYLDIGSELTRPATVGLTPSRVFRRGNPTTGFQAGRGPLILLDVILDSLTRNVPSGPCVVASRPSDFLAVVVGVAVVVLARGDTLKLVGGECRFVLRWTTDV